MKSKDLLSLMVPGQVRLELTPSQPPHPPTDLPKLEVRAAPG